MTFDEATMAAAAHQGHAYRAAWATDKNTLNVWQLGMERKYPKKKIVVMGVGGTVGVFYRHGVGGTVGVFYRHGSDVVYLGNKGLLSVHDLAADDWEYTPF